jgi:hypothetical protein
MARFSKFETSSASRPREFKHTSPKIMPLENVLEHRLRAFPTMRDQLDHDHHRLLTLCVGAVTTEDLVNHLEHLDACGLIGYDQLTDLTEAHFASDTGQLRWLAAVIRTKTLVCPLGRTAYLVGNDLAFGLTRMLSAFAEPEHTINVFRHRFEALEWLGWSVIPRGRVTAKQLGLRSQA